jgi:transaldolase
MSNRLQDLSAVHGQSPWIDNLKRGFLGAGGGLEQLVTRGVRGVTSNPTIFQKAIAGSNDYDEQFAELINQGHSTESAYWVMVSQDATNACDQLAGVFEQSAGIDGYVSLEVSPLLAQDTDGTTVAARDLHTNINVPNLMVKIPATAPCVPSIQQMIAEGRNINVTLIFSIDRYADVMEAYIAGLEQLLESGTYDLSGVASVASFFISRVDSEADKRLTAIGTPEALALQGKTAIAQAVLAYHLFRQTFSGPRWNRLAAHGARVQRPLWASTSTKNPSFPDTLYVDTLIGPDTVNTLPDNTLEAFSDHGTLARTVDTVAAVAEAHAVMIGLAAVGVELDDVAATLEREGVASFVKSFEDLMTTLDERGVALKAATA